MRYDITTYEFSDPDLAAAIYELDEYDRTVVILHLMGYTQREIADMMTLTHGTISKRLAAIREQLRGRLCGFSKI